MGWLQTLSSPLPGIQWSWVYGFRPVPAPSTRGQAFMCCVSLQPCCWPREAHSSFRGWSETTASVCGLRSTSCLFLTWGLRKERSFLKSVFPVLCPAPMLPGTGDRHGQPRAQALCGWLISASTWMQQADLALVVLTEFLFCYCCLCRCIHDASHPLKHHWIICENSS